jgi:hypothetical protein
MEWLEQNWLITLFFIFMIAMHLFGHKGHKHGQGGGGGCCGGGHDSESHDKSVSKTDE